MARIRLSNGRYAVAPGTKRAAPPRKVKDPSASITPDGRRRFGRRLREIERLLRAAIVKTGRVVDIGVDLQIGAAAQAALQIEIIRVRRSRGEFIDDVHATRWLNLLDRALNRLELTTLVLEPPRPIVPLRERLAAEAGA